MHNKFHSAARNFRILIVACLPSLASCSTGQLPPNAPSIAPMPTRTEASRVDRAIRNIEVRPYFKGPNIKPDFLLFPFSAKREGPAVISFKNTSDCTFIINMQGPTSRSLTVLPGRSQLAYVAEGRYKISLDPRPCTNVLFPAYQEDSFDSGRTYAFPLSIEEVTSGGELIMHNNSGSSLTVTVAGISRAFGSDPITIRLPQGEHTITASIAGCGSTVDRVTLSEGDRLNVGYRCIEREGVISNRP